MEEDRLGSPPLEVCGLLCSLCWFQFEFLFPLALWQRFCVLFSCMISIERLCQSEGAVGKWDFWGCSVCSEGPRWVFDVGVVLLRTWSLAFISKYVGTSYKIHNVCLLLSVF